MLIASIGNEIKPIESVVRELNPQKIVLFRYNSNSTNTIEAQLGRLCPKARVEFEHLEPPNDSSDASTNNVLNRLHNLLNSYTEQESKAVVCVTGGTPWLSHTLHHAAIMAELPVIVSAHINIEGTSRVFSYPNPLVAERMRALLEGAGANNTRIRLIQRLADGPATIQELASHLAVSAESIRVLINGRERDEVKDSEEMVKEGLEGMDQAIVKLCGKRRTEKRGPRPFEYDLTDLGRAVHAVLLKQSEC